MLIPKYNRRIKEPYQTRCQIRQDRIKATARNKRNGEIYDEATFESDLLDV